jgi:hypothetical protein
MSHDVRPASLFTSPITRQLGHSEITNKLRYDSGHRKRELAKANMNRRTFGSILVGAAVSAAVVVLSKLPLLRSALALSRTGRILSREHIGAAKRDLRTIVNVEIDFIKKRKKFASLDELVSRGDLGRHMLGRFGYVYNICLSGKSINASASPSPSEMLPAVHVTFFGPGLDPILASVRENNSGLTRIADK